MPSELKSSVVKGTVWALLERFSTQFVSFFLGIVLARLLTPEDFGTVALLSIFISVASVLADSGFGLALIQKKQATELDFNSVFYFSLALSSILYIILFVFAPIIADFYSTPVLIPILRLQSLSLIFGSINSIQNAEISRNLKFNLSFRISLISTITSAIVGVGLAFCGYGVWSLVWSSVVAGLVGTIARWFIVQWRPKLIFSFSVLKPLFAYGWKMIAVNLLDTVYKNLYGLLIGKFYSKEDLAYVNKGQGQPAMIMGAVEGTLARVTLPTFSKLQDDRQRLMLAMRKMITCSSFVVFPLLTIIGCTAHSQVLLLYGEKWLPAVPYVQIACFQMALYPFHNMNLQAIAAIGRTDLSLKIEIIKKIVSFTGVFISIQYGVMALMLCLAFIVGPICVVINAWPNRKLFGYTVWMQIMDVLPAAVLCLIAGTCMYLVSFLELNYILELLFQASVGIALYIILACLFRLRAAKEYYDLISEEKKERIPRFVSKLINTIN